jgi:hypothetical protein
LEISSNKFSCDYTIPIFYHLDIIIMFYYFNIERIT